MKFVVKSGDLFGQFDVVGNRPEKFRVTGVSWMAGPMGEQDATLFPTRKAAEHVAGQVEGFDAPPEVILVAPDYAIQTTANRSLHWLCKTIPGRPGGGTGEYEWRTGKAGKVYAARFSTAEEAQTVIGEGHAEIEGGSAEVVELVEED